MTHADTRESSGTEQREFSRLPYIQGLRAVAVLAVVAFHAGLPVPGGFVGVDIFFVISGFVITLMLRREWMATGTVRLRTFYRRRFQRLAPALALMVFVTILVSALVLSPFGFQQRAALTAVGAELSVANFVIAFTTGGYFDFIAAVNPLLHTWSLSVEEQFYLVFPGLLLLTWVLSRRLRRHWPTAVMLVVVCLVAFAAAVVSSTGWTPRIGASLLGFYSPLTRAWEFGVGALLALGVVRLSRLPVRVLAGVGWVGVAMLVAALWAISGQTPFPGPWTLLPVIGASCLIVGGLAEESRVGRALSWRPAVVLGDWSYSYYLWHWPFIVFAGLLWPRLSGVLLVAAVVSLAPAIASFTLVEQPIRQRGRFTRRWFASLAAVSLVPPILVAGGLYVAANHGWGMARMQAEMATGLPRGSGMTPDCITSLTIKESRPAKLESCTFNAEATGDPLYLLGDSNAAMYWGALNQVAQDLGRPLLISTAADCPFLDVYRSSQWGVAADRACRSYFEDELDRLSSERPGTVVLASTIRYANDPTYAIGAQPGSLVTEPMARVDTLANGLQSAVEKLQAQGHRVVIVEPTYRFEDWGTPITLDRCSLVGVVRNVCPVTIPVDEIVGWQEAYRTAVARVAETSGSGLVDMGPLQCPDGQCSDFSGSTRVYDDPGHLTTELTLKAVPDFEAAIARADAAR